MEAFYRLARFGEEGVKGSRSFTCCLLTIL